METAAVPIVFKVWRNHQFALYTDDVRGLNVCACARRNCFHFHFRLFRASLYDSALFSEANFVHPEITRVELPGRSRFDCDVIVYVTGTVVSVGDISCRVYNYRSLQTNSVHSPLTTGSQFLYTDNVFLRGYPVYTQRSWITKTYVHLIINVSLTTLHSSPVLTLFLYCNPLPWPFYFVHSVQKPITLKMLKFNLLAEFSAIRSILRGLVYRRWTVAKSQ